MKKLVFFFILASFLSAKAQKTPDAILDKWHQAAANANFEIYFTLMAKDAVYVGTDATERWTKKEFKVFAKPYFDKGQGWTFVPLKRNIIYSENKNLLWFDELLDSPHMGLVRGSGVLERVDKNWKIKHYVLSFTIPNEKAREVTQLKETLDKKQLGKLNQTD